jgi:hypothetical protein
MEENRKTEQFLEMNEEQMQAATGGVLPEPKERTSPIAFNRMMADKLFTKANLASERGYSSSLVETIANSAIEHLDRAQKFEAEKVAGKQPIIESSPKPSTSTNVNRSLRINR